MSNLTNNTEELNKILAAVNALPEAGGGSSGGDDVLNAMIDRSIEEVESTATEVGQYAFRGCTSLKSVTMPNVQRTSTNAFATCTSLETINLPSLKNGAGYEFSGCVNLTEVALPNLGGFTSCMFQNCSKLKRVCAPSATSSNANAFQSCVALEEIDFLGGFIIGTNAFNGATKLSRLIIRGNKLSNLQNVSAFTNTPFAIGGTGGTVYVPSALIETYKTATNWSTLYSGGTCNFVALEGSEYE